MGKNKPLLWTAILTAAGTGSAAAQITGTPAAGDYYFKNVESGKFLGGANAWGTQASLIDHGIVFKVALNNGKYTLDSNFKDYFTGTFMDGAAADVEITETATPGQYIMKVGDKYLAAADKIIANSEADATKAAKWQIIPVADLKKAFETATFDAPADATFLIKGANVSRNFEENSAWQGGPAFYSWNATEDDTEYIRNIVAEKWNTDFDVYQEIADVPNGLYKLTVQGFYRPGSNGATGDVVNAKLYANENSVDIPSINSESPEGGALPNDMKAASKVFLAGLYKSAPVYVYVSDGKLRVGIKKETTIDDDWTAFDNFELAYVGDINIDAVRTELTQKLAIQINKAGKYTDDADLQSLAVDAATLQTEINKIVVSNPDAYVMVANYQSGVKGNIGEQIDELGSKITAATANYEAHVAALTGHGELETYLKSLTDTYNKAQPETKEAAKDLYNSNVKMVADFKAAAEKAYADKTAAAEFSKENIDKKSAEIKKSIDEAIKAITSGSTNALSYANVVAKITEAKNAYNDEAANLYALLSGAKDGEIYNDTYVEALSKLNAYSRAIKAVEDANKADYDAGKANAETQAKYEAELTEAIADLPSVYDEYEELASTLRGNYAAATADVDALAASLKVVKDAIGNRLEVNSFYAKDFAAITEAIKALQANVDKANAAHTIKGTSPYCEKYDEDKAAIVKSTTDLGDKVSKSITEFDKNAASLATIDAAQAKFTAAKGAVAKMVSKNTQYKAEGRFAASEKAIQEAIDKLSKGASEAYKVDGTGTAADYNSKLSTADIETSITGYQDKAAASLAAYEAVAAAVAEYNALLNGTPAVGEEGKEGYVPATPGLKGTATNTEVTVDGTLEGKSYAAAITEIEKAIAGVQAALDAALGKADVEHYNAITKVDVKADIKTTIETLTADYEANDGAWNKAQLAAAKVRLLQEATRRAEAVVLEDSYDEAVYGKKATDFNTANAAIAAALEKVKNSIDEANKFAADKDAEAIALLATVVEDLKKIEADFNKLSEDAKKAKDEFAADQAALKELNGQVALSQAKLNGGKYNNVDYKGVAATATIDIFTDEIAAVNAAVTTIAGEITASGTAETVRADRDKENGYATRLTAIGAQIDNLLALAAAEAANEAANAEFIKVVADAKVADKFAEAKTKVEAAATLEGEAFFLDELDAYFAAYEKVISDQGAAYGAKVKSELPGTIKDAVKYTDTTKNMAAKKSALKAAFDEILGKVAGIEALAKANEEAHNAQTNAATDTQNAWDELFNEITNDQTSTAHEAAIATLTKAKNDLDAYNDAVAKAFKTGKCETDKATLEAQLSAINTAIKSLNDGWDDTYNAAVAADNAERKTAYDNAYKTLTEVYAESTALVNKLSKLSYASGEAATDKLLSITGEDGIYDYIDKIRELNTKANASYNETKAPALWDVEGEYAALAVKYQKIVNGFATEYSDEVNNIATLTYNTELTEAKDAVAAAKADINDKLGLGEKAQGEAVEDVQEIINNAEKRVELPDFAYYLETEILPAFASIDNKLAADKETAAVKTWKAEISAATTLAAAEKETISKFGVEARDEKYVDEYDKAVVEVVAAAADAWDNIKEGEKFDNFASAADILKKIATATRGKQTQTEKFWSVYDLEQEYIANNTAHAEMQKAIANVQSELDKAAEYVGSLLVEHNANLNDRLGNVQTEIESLTDAVKDALENAKSAEAKKDIIDACEVQLGAIKGIYGSAIDAEKAAIAVEIGQLKKDYDMAVAEDIEDTTIDQYKEEIEDYEAANDSIYKASTEGIIEKYDDKGTPVYKKDANGERVTSTYAETQAAYLALEKGIGQTKTALTAIYDEAAAVNAAASVSEAIAGLQDTYEALDAQLDDCHEPVVKDYQPKVDALKASIDAAQAEFDQNTEDGTVLLYAENLLQSISEVAEAYEGLGKDIEDAEKPYDLNEKVYQKLSDELAELKANLEEVKDAVAKYEYKAPWAEQMFENIETEIEDAKAVLDDAYKDCELTADTKNPSGIQDEIDGTQNWCAYSNANQTLAAISKTLDEAYWDGFIGNLNDASKLYTKEDQAALVNAQKVLSTTYSNITEYNYNAYNNGVVFKDINGNPCTDDKGNEVSSKEVDDYMAEYETVMAKAAELKAAVEQFAEDVDAKSYIMGDIDHNDKINVNDYNYVRNIVIGALEVDPTDTRYLSADVNNDGDVNIADVIQIANKIMTGEFTGIAENGIKARINSRITEQSADSQLDVKATGSGSKQTITIAIDNISNFVGAQMDIELPAGVTIASESGVVSHDFISGTVNSKHRVLLSSLDNETFSNEELVTLNVEVSGDYKGGSVLISNAIFSDAEGKQYILGGAETGEATGIVELTLGEKVANKIFSVGGQLLDGMKKGINIIMNTDGTTKKVLKK
ncbi:MAG: hypothetical protein Q4F47_04630 [Bacteroidaceae bacterium]|nr:hypothetical protein [Bacteroidaceae bacterium]